MAERRSSAGAHAWMCFEQERVMPGIGGVRFRLVTGRATREELAPRLETGRDALATLEAHPAGRDWLVGDGPTIADRSVWATPTSRPRSASRRARPSPRGRSGCRRFWPSSTTSRPTARTPGRGPGARSTASHRRGFGRDTDTTIAADAIRKQSGCVLRYERSFLRPLLPAEDD